MKIKKCYLDLILNNIKKHEYRLYNEERKNIKINDLIKLIDDNNPLNYLIVKVKSISVYKDFDQALINYYKEDFNGLYDNYSDCLNACNKFYPKNLVEKYGIGVFEIELQKDI